MTAICGRTFRDLHETERLMSGGHVRRTNATMSTRDLDAGESGIPENRTAPRRTDEIAIRVHDVAFAIGQGDTVIAEKSLWNADDRAQYGEC